MWRQIKDIVVRAYYFRLGTREEVFHVAVLVYMLILTLVIAMVGARVALLERQMKTIGQAVLGSK